MCGVLIVVCNIILDINLLKKRGGEEDSDPLAPVLTRFRIPYKLRIYYNSYNYSTYNIQPSLYSASDVHARSILFTVSPQLKN